MRIWLIGLVFAAGCAECGRAVDCEGLERAACEEASHCEAVRYEMDEPPWGGFDCLPIR